MTAECFDPPAFARASARASKRSDAATLTRGQDSMSANIGDTKLDDPITEFGLALLASREDHWEPVGSAIVIGPHLALTAKHIVDYCQRALGDHYKTKLGIKHQDFSIVALQVLPGGVGGLWCV